jgi:hypothetical protein
MTGGLQAGQPGGDQRGDVAVAAVLAQQRDGVEQLQVRLGRPGQVGVAGVERAALGRAALAGGAGQLERLDDVGAVEQVAAHPAQRPVGGAVAGLDELGRRRDVPRAGHAELRGDRGEVEERRLHDARRHRAHRRRARREVAGRAVGLEVEARARRTPPAPSGQK